QKIKKGQDLTIPLIKNPDILAEVAARRGQTGLPRLVIGFAAETEDLLANAAAKLKSKNLDLIVANDVTQPSSGFGSDDNRVTLLYPDGRQEPLPILAKTEVAERVLYATLRLIQ
ncbi:MAG TPA: phosphopantothenoylcysteine decarboxylase, partial [Anaerolineae bacterium]